MWVQLNPFHLSSIFTPILWGERRTAASGENKKQKRRRNIVSPYPRHFRWKILLSPLLPPPPPHHPAEQSFWRTTTSITNATPQETRIQHIQRYPTHISISNRRNSENHSEAPRRRIILPHGRKPEKIPTKTLKNCSYAACETIAESQEKHEDYTINK